ncbi:hypothetical protein E2C01_089147 [Portunus trituberculatus]|uniref:Uncharacterized protein n=1 Tax=Portunus trituberculatus TaxID=210409 RepID=A0A5B7JLF9_PORTR|nr:hypothetical protein [Portunus trituberculatus]
MFCGGRRSQEGNISIAKSLAEQTGQSISRVEGKQVAHERVVVVVVVVIVKENHQGQEPVGRRVAAGRQH